MIPCPLPIRDVGRVLPRLRYPVSCPAYHRELPGTTKHRNRTCVLLLTLLLTACGNHAVRAPLPAVYLSDADTTEGDTGTRELLFPVDLDAPSSREIRIHFRTSDGSAKAGSDYRAAAGTLMVPPNSTSATIGVTILGDDEAEEDETFSIILSDPVNARLGSAEAYGTIIDDDDQIPRISIPCTPSATGTDYPVGPGRRYASIAEVPWGRLDPGDTVRIHYSPDPYREKIVIRSSGTEQAPIRICGVPGPNGERPVLDGDGASNDP
ncbi:MAG TPA: hypothetical protein ENJ43_03235, partial [Gammaproteobacteria bacterium]|nr:hypothetical protein [Gammaproteobacteria bacterium]